VFYRSCQGKRCGEKDLSARWTDEDYAAYLARAGVKFVPSPLNKDGRPKPFQDRPKRDYKTEFEQQLALVGIQVEREFYFARPRKWRSDWRVTGSKLLVEYEGGLFMESGGAHKAVGNILRDIEKYNAAAIAGWTVIRVTPKFIPDGQALKWVEDALKSSRAQISQE
jgi:hypothetical protein